MLAFLTQRLLQIIPTLILVSMLIFGLQQLLPGDPALIMAGEERDPKVLEEIRQQYRLNERIATLDDDRATASRPVVRERVVEQPVDPRYR